MHPPVRGPDPNGAARGYRLWLLGGWRLTYRGADVPQPASAQRLLALLALRGERERSYLARTLWPASMPGQALTNLRATLARLRTEGQPLIRANGGLLALADLAFVDATELVARAVRLLDPATDVGDGTADSALLVSGDLLPGWYDDWVLVERERLRELRLMGLEALAERLRQDGRHAGAIDAALAATQIEPLRETAYRTIVRIHLAEGNVVEALRRYERFADLLHRELGVSPTSHLRRLIRPFRPGA